MRKGEDDVDEQWRAQQPLDPQIANLTSEIVEALSGNPFILGIALCGSHCDGTCDGISDLDVWVYHASNLDSEEKDRLVELTPGNFSQKIPHGEYGLAEYIESGVLVSVKYISAGVFEDFLADQRSFALDEMLLEDLETYLKWRVIWEREAFLTQKTTEIRNQFKGRRSVILRAAERRYGDMIWRSVFQGVYRSDLVQWKMLVYAALNSLVIACALNRCDAPPPMKWRFSSVVLGRYGFSNEMRSLISRIANVSEFGDILEVYATVYRVEDRALAFTPGKTRWWWEAFDFQSQGIELPEELANSIREMSSQLRFGS